MPEQVKPNLYQKILLITEEVGTIAKTGTNSSQGYKFIEQSLVVAEVRVQLAKHGVVIIPETVERKLDRYTTMKPGYKATDPPKEQATIHANVKSRYTIINADNPEERMVCEWDAGEALDTSDKATNKAVTASDKSFLMKLFKISDKDDPDASSPNVPAKPSEVTKIINPIASPEEPSRDIKDEPISNISMQKVRVALAATKMDGAEITNYCQFVINKPAPTTEADAATLLNSLKDK